MSVEYKARLKQKNIIDSEKAKIITQFQKDEGIPSSWLREVAETRASVKDYSNESWDSLSFLRSLKIMAFDLMEAV